MQKVLITGGAGNVGSSLVKKLLHSGLYKVTVVDNLTTGSAKKLPAEGTSNFEFIKADTNNYHDIAAVMLSRSFDFVFHYAAVVGVKRTLDNPIRVLQDIEGIKNILDLSKNTGVKRVFYSSSSEVYGEPVEFPQNEETTPLNSRLPYAIVKNVGESFFKSYFREYGLNFTIFRFFNTYGPDQSEDFVVPRFIKLARQNEPITLYGDGLQTRTFCHAEDNVETALRILRDDLCINEVINIGNDKEMTILELAKVVIAATGSSSKIVHLPPLKEGDMSRRLPDISKMKSILQRELITLEEGIKTLL